MADLTYNMMELARKDPFEIKEIPLLQGLDIEEYYTGIGSSFVQKVIEGYCSFERLEIQSFGDFGKTTFYMKDHEAILKYTAFRDTQHMKKGDIVIKEPYPDDLRERIDVLFKVFDNIRDNPLEIVEEHPPQSLLVRIATDIMSFRYYDGDHDHYFVFDFHHEQEKRSLTKKVKMQD